MQVGREFFRLIHSRQFHFASIDVNFILFDRNALNAKHFELIEQWKIENGGSVAKFDDLAKINGISERIVANLREFCEAHIANATIISEDRCQTNMEFVPGAEHLPDDMFSNNFHDGGSNNSSNFIIYDEAIPSVELDMRTDVHDAVGHDIRLVLEPKKRDSFERINSFTTIYQEADAITAARFSTTNQWAKVVTMDAWTRYPTETFGLKNASQIYERLHEIVSQLPTSDIYIIDDHIKAQRFYKSVPPKIVAQIVQVNHQFAILVALLHKISKRQSKHDEPDVYFMGYRSVGRLFNLFVGNEPISTQSTVRSILNGDFSDKTLRPLQLLKIDVDDALKQAYHKSRTTERECLGRSMLTGLTFIHLGIHRTNNPKYSEKPI